MVENRCSVETRMKRMLGVICCRSHIIILCERRADSIGGFAKELNCALTIDSANHSLIAPRGFGVEFVESNVFYILITVALNTMMHACRQQ